MRTKVLKFHFFLFWMSNQKLSFLKLMQLLGLTAEVNTMLESLGAQKTITTHPAV